MRYLALSYINVTIQLEGGPPLTSVELAGDMPVTYLFGLTNVAAILERLISREPTDHPMGDEFVGAVESVYDLLEDDDLTLTNYSSAGSVEHFDGSNFPPLCECLMCDGREDTPEGALRDVDENGNEIILAGDATCKLQRPNLDALLA
jgi:hypothetical protein